MSQKALNSHYAALLGLDEDWKVDEVKLDLAGSKVEIALAFTGKKATCSECGNNCSTKDHSPERQWRHLDTMNFETVLKARVPRANCSACGVKVMTVPWAGKHGRFTLMFEAFAIAVLEAASSTEAARHLLGLSWDSLQGIMDRAVERGIQRRDLNDVTKGGLDEKSFRRAQSYVTMFNDLEQSRVIDVVEGRTINDTRRLIESCLPAPHNRWHMRAMAIDMWPAYINAVSDLMPNADIVFDRFHVSKYLNEAVDQVRRAEHKVLIAEGRSDLTGSRYSWLKSEENRTEKQQSILENLCGKNLKTSRAWAIKESFNEFWNSRNEGFAEGVFRDWYGWAIRSQLPPIKKVAKMIKKHLYGLMPYFEHRITNAVSEGINSKVQALKVSARGFRNFENYRTRILFFCGKLDLLPKISH